MIALSDFEKEEFDLPAFSCLCYHFVCNFVHAYKFRGNFFSPPLALPSPFACFSRVTSRVSRKFYSCVLSVLAFEQK